MRNAIILHGMPSRREYYAKHILSMSNLHWLPWLQSQLLKNDIAASTPEVPESYAPKWEAWVREVERFEIGPQTILVGHSAGGGFWLKYLSVNKNLVVGKIILVAPWTDPDGDEAGEFFKNWKIDPDLLKRVNKIIIFHSTNDMGNVHKSVAAIRQGLPGVDYREFKNFGHFIYKDMKTQQFPQLLEECLND